jgi:hypothetical protein
MSWTDHILNPKAVSQLYTRSPNLDEAELGKLELNNSPNPTLGLYISTSALPDRPTPIRWPKGFKRVSIHLQMMTIRELQIPCWQFDNTVRVTIESTSDGYRLFRACWPSGEIMRCVADFILIGGIEGYGGWPTTES